MQEPFLIAYKKILYDSLYSRGVDAASIKALIGYLDWNNQTNQDLSDLITNLENNATIYQIYEFVGQSTSGTVTIPEEGEIYDLYQDGVIDALAVVASEENTPTTIIQSDTNEDEITVTTFDSDGNYVLSNTPISDTCLIYWIKILDKYKSNVSESTIIPPTISLGDDKVNALLDQITVLEDGDDQGVYFKNQVSVLGELVIGTDSYPVPYAWHCKVSETTGKIITNAIDRSEILQSDTESSVGLFNGEDVGNFLLTMSPDDPHEGVKAKYDTLGTVEPDNVTIEYYKNDTDTWGIAPIMGTNSNPPYKATADQISVNSVEQIYFGFDPLIRGESYNWDIQTFNINGQNYTGYFSRIRILTEITLDPIVQQIKLHSNSVEIESMATFYKGFARRPVHIPFEVVKNDLSDPTNESVDYTPNYAADYVDNELANGQKDGFGVIFSRIDGLDSSVPVVIELTFYVKGTVIGDIDLDYEVSQIIDDYIYDGTEDYDAYNKITSITVSQNLARFTIQLPIPINKLAANSAIVTNIFRDASATRDDDTLAASIIRTSVTVTGYKWKN